jgi:hypothetical protein
MAFNVASRPTGIREALDIGEVRPSAGDERPELWPAVILLLGGVARPATSPARLVAQLLGGYFAIGRDIRWYVKANSMTPSVSPIVRKWGSGAWRSSFRRQPSRRGRRGLAPLACQCPASKRSLTGALGPFESVARGTSSKSRVDNAILAPILQPFRLFPRRKKGTFM